MYAGDLERLQILSIARNIDVKDIEGNTALIRATEHGNEKLVEWLLENGAKVRYMKFVKKLPNHENIVFNKFTIHILSIVYRIILVQPHCIGVPAKVMKKSQNYLSKIKLM